MYTAYFSCKRLANWLSNSNGHCKLVDLFVLQSSFHLYFFLEKTVNVLLQRHLFLDF